MFKRLLPAYILLTTFVLSACGTSRELTSTPTTEESINPTPTLTPSPPVEPRVLISEVMAGVDGNNNYDFIELYNTGVDEPIDLMGWSIWFKLADGQKESLVYRWSEHALVPPQGHYLLVREGQDVGTTFDMIFETPLTPQKGSLQLRLTDGTVVDSLTWGGGASDYTEGSPANAMENNIALERKPGGGDGNWTDTDDNAADFAFSDPNPQGVGSPRSPEPEAGLSVSVEAPRIVTPGSQFEYLISVVNDTDEVIHSVVVQLPVSKDLEIIQVPTGAEVTDKAQYWGLDHIGEKNHVVLLRTDSLAPGEEISTSIAVLAPWTYLETLMANYSVQAEDVPSPAFGSPVRVSVEGGSIPIGTLKDLVGKDIAIEGTATMYTGGYYAGTGNVKFYLEDETGGVQVWVPEGEGSVNIAIGSKVRVYGGLTLYRGALELVVNDPADVEVLAGPKDNPAWQPTAASITDAANDSSLAGKLVQIEGIITRNEEFSYSYEIDLIDETGQVITLYVDKLTNINVEVIESGQIYRTTGILEIRDTRQQLYPRIQDDLERIYPPILAIEMDAPITILPGENLVVSLTAYNYTTDPLTDLVITATLPRRGGVQFVSASEGFDLRNSSIIWNIPQLAGDGASTSVSYEVQVVAEDEYLTFQNYKATANEWPEPASGDPYLVFLGKTVPIWAIQGVGGRSPFTLKPVRTGGIVTGVFPGLGGFWIQELDTDQEPLTSAGLFVNTGELEIPVTAENYVMVNGIVRETFQQTQVQVSNPEDIVILEKGGSLPDLVELDPPQDESEANAYYESIEGMLVQVSEPGLAVGATTQYGEYVLVLAKHGVDRLWQGDSEHNGLAIRVDDGSTEVHEDRSGLDYVVNTGDLVTNLVGPLAYTFGRYKVEPIVQPLVTHNDPQIPAMVFSDSDTFSIMTWNVENLFDVFDPHPSSPERPSLSEYKVSITKIANTILAAGAPTIVGLQEVENIDVLEDIAGHEYLAGYGYQSFLIEGTDSRYIDNGYLVRGDSAEVVDVEQHIAPEGLTSRPPLRLEVEIETGSTPVRLFVLNNHFTSMSGGVEATEPRRNAQAAWNAVILEGILSENPEALVAVIGDLNSFYDSLPIDTLRNAGLVHVFEIDPEMGWYSYIFEGASQTLDHILVTPSLFDLIQRVDVLHLNADFAPPMVGDESPLGKSDHDPVIATFSLSE
jgi:DNA/RNA endonuclease YhcR with UshA esterase domain